MKHVVSSFVAFVLYVALVLFMDGIDFTLYLAMLLPSNIDFS